ncbi:uncharacterized protein RHO25_010312 [Cercospora beticola]|nr:hypothetical protein RHO25_010312 [Cercospora beticola]
MKAYSALATIAGVGTVVAKADPAAIKRQESPRPYGYPPPGYGLPTSSGISGPVVSTSTSAAESAGATEVSPIGASDSSSAPDFTPSFSSLPRTGGPLTTSTSTRYFTESIVWPFPIGTSVTSTEGSPVTPSSSSFWYGNSSTTALVGPTGTGAASPTSTFTSRSTTTVTRETTIYLSPVPTGTAPTGSTEGSPVGASSSPFYGNGTSSSTALAGPTASNGFWPTGVPSTYGGFSTTLPWSGYPSSSSGGIEVSPTDATETTDSFPTTSFSVSYGTGILSSSSDDGSTEVSPVTGSESSTSTSSGFVTSTTRAWGAPLPYGPQSTTYGGPEAYGAYGQNKGRGGGWGWWGWRGE